MKKFLLASLCCLIAIQLDAQNSVPELITDRPDRVESSVTVPHKSLQIETGCLYEHSEDDLLETSSFLYNSTLLRYGLLENLELRLGVEYEDSKTLIKETDEESSLSGLLPLSIGVKVNITEQDGFIPEMALLSHLALPNTGLEDFQSETLTPDMILSMSYELSPKLSTGVNVGAEWNDGSSKAAGVYSWVFGIALNDKAGAFIETYGSFAKDEDFENGIDGGLTYLIRPNLQIDIAGGFAVTENLPDYFIGAGLSFRVPK